MRVLVLGADNASVDMLSRAAGVAVHLEFTGNRKFAERRVSGDPPPDGLILTGESIGHYELKMVERLSGRGWLVPTGIFLRQYSMSFDRVSRLWLFARFEIVLLGRDSELGRRLVELAGSLGLSVARYLRTRLPIRDPVATAALEMLSRRAVLNKRNHIGSPEVDLLTLSPQAIASELNVSRSTLYDHLNGCNLPGISELQMLFRLLIGMRVIRTGGSTRKAARVARLKTEKSFRNAFRRRFDTSIRQLCNKSGWRWFVDRWIGLHCQ